MIPGSSEYDIKMCYDNIVEGIVDDNVNKVIDIFERNTDEIKRIMTNFKLYYLFYKTKSKEMLIILLDYFDVKNIFDITNLLPSIITAAIRHDMDIKMIQRLIERGGDINDTDVTHVSPLLQCLKSKRNVNFVKAILKMGANVNEICDMYGNTILHIAINNLHNSNDIEVIKLLIDSDADINAKNKYREKPLMRLQLNANDDLWFELINGKLVIGESRVVKYSLGNTFLTDKIFKKSRIKKFLSTLNCNQFTTNTMNDINIRSHYGADVNAIDGEGYSSLIYAIRYDRDIDVIIKLIEHGADVNVIDNNGLTPLNHAVHSCMFKEIIQILLDNGVNINTHNEHNNTLLLYILKDVNYNKELVNFVLEKGADVNICDNNGLTPIMYVVLYGKKSIKLEMISTLIESGADVDAIDKNSRTALCHAFFQRDCDNEEILVLLLDNGASVRKYLSNLGESETPLIYALRCTTGVEIIIELLYCKEDINENGEDHTSFLCKLFSSHVELAFLLISDHKDLVKKDKPLIFNIFKNAPEIYVEKIFYNDLNINDLDNVHRMKFMYEASYRRIVKLIDAVLEKRYAKLSDSEFNSLLCFGISQDVIIMLILYSNADVIKHLLLILPEELDKYSLVKLDFTGFINNCNVDLNKMQSINIIDNLSFFKFCCNLSEYEMNLISESDNFCVYNDEQIKQMFPIYCDVIIMKIKKCKIILSKKQVINALERLIISNRIIKSYDPKKYKDDKNYCCSVEHSDQLCECVFLNYDILYCISKYLCDKHIVNLLLASL